MPPVRELPENPSYMWVSWMRSSGIGQHGFAKSLTPVSDIPLVEKMVRDSVVSVSHSKVPGESHPMFKKIVIAFVLLLAAGLSQPLMACSCDGIGGPPCAAWG